MTVIAQIKSYLSSLAAPTRIELQELYATILGICPGCKQWYGDGKNAEGKIVSNPNIGFGSYNIHYANGTKREFFKVGISANTSGISVYILGIKDKAYLAQTFGQRLGKATVTAYCIRFKH